jgi:PadR family transcriptional regulator, regulatory protein PadR
MAMPRPPNASRQTHLLLAALLEQPRAWRHGYELAKETGIKSGTLYPLLMRLGDQGLLDARWQDSNQPGKPPRHMYRPTAAGLALAREQRSRASMRGWLSKRLNVGV